jgi:hypothetical protein
MIAGMLLLAGAVQAAPPEDCLSKPDNDFTAFWRDQIACAATSWHRQTAARSEYVCGWYDREHGYAASCRNTAPSCWIFDKAAFLDCMGDKGYEAGASGYRVDWRVKLRKGVCSAPTVNLAEAQRALATTTQQLADTMPPDKIARLSRLASCSAEPR